MKFLFPVFVVLIIISFSCTDTPQSPTPVPANTEKKIIPVSKPPGSFSDTLIIAMPAAVFYNPDSLQLAKISAKTALDEFETQKHNCFYLMRNARTVLKKYWPEIHLIETSRARYLLFLKDNKDQVLIDLNGQGDMCGIFLFDGTKAPELADMMNIDTALGFYFGH